MWLNATPATAVKMRDIRFSRCALAHSGECVGLRGLVVSRFHACLLRLLYDPIASDSGSQLAEAVGSEIVNEELVSAFVQLLKDNEAEVRTAGAGQIPGTSSASIHCNVA